MNGNTFTNIFAKKKKYFYQSYSQRLLFLSQRDSSQKSIKKVKPSGNETDIFMSFDTRFCRMFLVHRYMKAFVSKEGTVFLHCHGLAEKMFIQKLIRKELSPYSDFLRF